MGRPSLGNNEGLHPDMGGVPGTAEGEPVMRPGAVFLYTGTPFGTLPCGSFGLQTARTSFSAFLSMNFQFGE